MIMMMDVRNQMSSVGFAKVVSLKELLEMNLHIPCYQRTYKWTTRSVNLLINDLKEVGEDEDCNEYRLGTIIVAANEEKLDIVDGQQRVVTLILLLKALRRIGEQINFKIPQDLEKEDYLRNGVTKESIIRNYTLIRSRFRRMGSSFIKSIMVSLDKLSFVFVRVENVTEAFQIFDSQNYRGKKLNPHDLLKAFHLRCMSEDLKACDISNIEERKKTAVKTWENRDQEKIHKLFNEYLHRIYRWKLKLPVGDFTEYDIDEFKGVERSLEFSYRERAEMAGTHFQIGQSFIAGEDFFSYVAWYEDLRSQLSVYVREEVKCKFEEGLKGEGKFKLEEAEGWIGFRHTWNLFECVCLCFVDKFGLEFFVKNKEYFVYLLTWAMLIRTNKSRVSFSGINNYALGNPQDRKLNLPEVNMFAVIDQARMPYEILETTLPVNDTKDKDVNVMWKTLKQILLNLN